MCHLCEELSYDKSRSETQHSECKSSESSAGLFTVIMCIFWSPLAMFRRIFSSDPPGVVNMGRGQHCGGQIRAAEDTLVFFDLETTGLDTSGCDIVQLSAISGEQTFNVYTLPRCPITPGASKVTGLTTKGRKLLLQGVPVDTVPTEEALESFISFLKTFNKPLLVGHNCKRFDSPILLRVLQEFCLLEDFRREVSGFLDTLCLSREMFDLPKYNQPFLVEHFLHKAYGAHNATEDVRTLQDLYRVWQPDTALVNRHKFRF